MTKVYSSRSWEGTLLGSRRGCDFSVFTGRSEQAAGAIQQTKKALLSKSARIGVATAVDVLAISNPSIGTLLAAYKISKALYQISRAASENFDKTGDASEAVAAGAKQALRIGVSEVTSQTVGTTIDTSWSVIKNVTGIKTNEFQDRILTSATKNTLEEAIKHDD